MIDDHKKLTLFEVSDLNMSPFAHFLGRKKCLHGNEFCTSELLRVFFWWGGEGGFIIGILQLTRTFIMKTKMNPVILYCILRVFSL